MHTLSFVNGHSLTHLHSQNVISIIQWQYATTNDIPTAATSDSATVQISG